MQCIGNTVIRNTEFPYVFVYYDLSSCILRRARFFFPFSHMYFPSSSSFYRNECSFPSRILHFLFPNAYFHHTHIFSHFLRYSAAYTPHFDSHNTINSGLCSVLRPHISYTNQTGSSFFLIPINKTHF